MNNFEKALEKNRTRYQARILKEIEQKKKQEKKEWIIFTFVALFIIIITFLLLNSMNKDFDETFKKCLNEGHSSNYCARTI